MSQCYDIAVTIAQASTKITALEAQAAANLFLLDNLSDHYLTVEPKWDDAGYVAHALVVIGVSDLTVQVIDPEKGERLLSRQKFHEGWKNRHRPAIIVEK